MARIDTGNALTSDLLQPGWTTTSDGFGLITINATFKSDKDSGEFAPFVRGTAFPVSSYNYCKSHTGSISWDSLGIATLKVNYIGIDPTVNSGVSTRANTSAANGLTSEHITSHPNFFNEADGYSEVIAGTSREQSDIGPLVEIKNPADYVSKIIGYNSDGTPITAMVTKQLSWVGNSGACFESETGGRFIGFVDPDYPSLYGKTNYLAATTTYSGVIYVAESSYVIDILGYLNTATSTTMWGSWELLPDWAIVGTVADVGHVNLLSQANVEEYGSLYKVSYEIRYAKYGWDSKVYINISGE